MLVCFIALSLPRRNKTLGNFVWPKNATSSWYHIQARRKMGDSDQMSLGFHKLYVCLKLTMIDRGFKSLNLPLT